MNLFINTFKGEKSSFPPIWFMRQAGRYLPEYRAVRKNFSNFLEFCYTPQAAAEVTLQPINRFGFDAAIIFSDILVIPDAMGVKTWFEQGEGPKLEVVENLSHLTCNADDIIQHLQNVFEALRLVRAELPKDKALIGFCGSPWTIAAYMLEGQGSRDFAKARMKAYHNPEFMHKLLDMIIKASLVYLDEQIKAGADALQIFDSWAGILPPSEYAKWVIEPNRRLVAGIKAIHPDIPIICFPKGSSYHYGEFAEIVKPDGMSIDYLVPMQGVRQSLTREVVLQGNLCPLLLASDKARAVSHAKRICKEMIDEYGYKNFVFNLGHGIIPSTPIDNVRAVIDAVRNYPTSPQADQ
jgi:uroporphyrinogen decarboxylase